MADGKWLQEKGCALLATLAADKKATFNCRAQHPQISHHMSKRQKSVWPAWDSNPGYLMSNFEEKKCSMFCSRIPSRDQTDIRQPSGLQRMMPRSICSTQLYPLLQTPTVHMNEKKKNKHFNYIKLSSWWG